MGRLGRKGDDLVFAELKTGPHLSTPALVVDLEVFEANVLAMSVLLRGTGKTVRPHVKTHRTPELARRQLRDGAFGITCATVGEAEAMVAAGIRDVLLANEVVDPAKIVRLTALARDAVITVAADDPQPVEMLSRQAIRDGVTLGVLVDVDILAHRCGVKSVEEAVALARVVEQAPGLRLGGVMGYEGRLRPGIEDREAKIAQAYGLLAEIREAFLAKGLCVDAVSAAGTSTLREALADPSITEIQAGTYALMEPQLVPLDLPFRCAVVIRGTVISRDADRAVLDVGRRTVGIEYGPPIPVGFSAAEVIVSDEHTTLKGISVSPSLGVELDMTPGQIWTTFNLHDRVWLSRRGSIVDCWPVTARGSSQ